MAKITVHRALISKALITIYGRFSWLAFAVVPAKCVLEIGLAYLRLVFDLVSPCRRRRLVDDKQLFEASSRAQVPELHIFVV